jgi:large subunit ribosomal protein L35
MPKIKTHKSIAKRFKISKTGRLMKKKAGQGHFNAREKGSVTRAKRRAQNTSERIAKPLKVLIPYSN